MVALLAQVAAVSHAMDNSECLACHADPDLTRESGETFLSLHVAAGRYAASVHQSLACTDCHVDILDFPHPAEPTAVDCKQCHDRETADYLASGHGMALSRGVTEAATCRACHGSPHALLAHEDPRSPVHRLNIPHTCAGCHGEAGKMDKYQLHQRGPVVSYEHSAHGIALLEKNRADAAVCTDCHGVHDLYPSVDPASRLHWQNIPHTCGQCHQEVEAEFTRSVHGQAVARGVRDAPVCTDCHGEHTISDPSLARSRVSAAHIPETCGQCHGAARITARYEIPADVVDTYMQSYHGLGGRLGNVTVASCASCHGHHEILPSTDPASSVNRANLPTTCGRCHPAIGTRLSKSEFRVHALPGAGEGKPWIVNLVARLYIGLIIITVGGMLVFNLVDYVAKTRRHVRTVKQMPHAEHRMTSWVRAQHAALIILFVVLAYTGFVHRYPDAVWSWPFQVLTDGGYWRGMIHRVAGWAFSGLFLLHLVVLVATRRGRVCLTDLRLRLADLGEAVATFRANLGLGTPPPRRRPFNYAEKLEYWALLWGSVMMIVTGIVLLFTEAALRWWPNTWHEVAQVIHFYEAILATLAIVVWHFYWVMFDPREYPMNPAWLIGRKAPAVDEDQQPTDETEEEG